MNLNREQDMTHVLYSSGKLLDTADRLSAIEKIASMTSKNAETIEERLLGGHRKRVKSSNSLTKLIRLEIKLKRAGFDVYIDKN